MEFVSESEGLDINDMDQMALTSIRRTVNDIGLKPLSEKLNYGIDDETYVTIATAELACLKLLLRVNSLRMQIDKLDEGTSYFHFTLFRDDDVSASGSVELGDTTCVIMGNDATQMLPIRRVTPAFQDMEKKETELPVVKMKFTRLRVNGFKGAEIIQRYIMCLCAIGGVHIMIKDIMTDLAGFQKDWNNNIGCFPTEDFGLSRRKYFDEPREQSQDTQSSLESSYSSNTSDSSDSYSSNTSDSSYTLEPDTTSTHEGVQNTCDVNHIPDIGREQAKELVYYFVFQYDNEIQQLLADIKILNPEENPKNYDDLRKQMQRAITNTRERVTSIKNRYFDEMYYCYSCDDANRKKAAAKEVFQLELENILSGIEYTYLNNSGVMPDYDFSPEAMLIIKKLFKTDLSGDYFKKNLIDIAARIQRIFPTGLNIDEFGASLDRILQQKLSPATAQQWTSRKRTRGASGTDGGGARKTTKKKQNKNKRASKKKKNKKRTIKTQKKKRNKTRK